MLYFISRLAPSRFDGAWEKYGVIPLESIHTIFDLYESIVRLLLVEHSATKGNKITATNATDVLRHLGEHAYQIFTTGSHRVTDKEHFQNIGLVYRNHDSENSFKFIHNSFGEYFLARYFLENPKETIIDTYKKLESQTKKMSEETEKK